MVVSRFLHLLLLCGIHRAIEGERPQRTQRRSRGLFVSDLPAVLSPQMASSPATSREDSLATAVFRFLGTIPDEPPPDSCLTSLEVNFVPYSHPPLEHWFYMTSSPFRSSTRLELNFCGDFSLYAPPKVVFSFWVDLLQRLHCFSPTISGDLSYGTWAALHYEWAWPIRSTNSQIQAKLLKAQLRRLGFFIEISWVHRDLSSLYHTIIYILWDEFTVCSSDSKLLLPYPLSMERGVSSVLRPSVCFSFLIGLSSCGAVSTGPVDAIESTLVFLVDEDWTSTSHYVTIYQLYDFVVKVPRRFEHRLNPLSSSIEDLSCLAYLCFIPSIYCIEED
ncbi:hypothetical protein Bca52824_091015 [Brassica carinata]|uniref:Uncharacterized protein n=1 Tax=Brassica carinata TaxID=52824 RepID=A0A8X7NXT0_BRACI|nr:hypothetical protein Bca52824_091015 [Brassica carinata]